MLGSPRHDGVAGVVLGVESVPDGLAGGLLAGVNPVYGLYGYLVGTFTGALTTSSSFMAVQATGAMAMVIADVDAVSDADDPARALFTLSLVTGILMIVAGVLRLGSVLRFVSNAVMVGFINAVGVNIVLGQLGNLTGYSGTGDNRVARAIDTILHPSRFDGQTLAIGLATMALIIALERTRLRQLGMVVAIVATSAAVVALGWDEVARLSDLAEVPRSLPRPALPDFSGSSSPCWSPRPPSPSSVSCRAPASPPTSPTRMAPTPTHPGTSSARAPPTSHAGSSKGCRSAGPCPDRRW